MEKETALVVTRWKQEMTDTGVRGHGSKDKPGPSSSTGQSLRGVSRLDGVHYRAFLSIPRPVPKQAYNR